MIKPGIYTMEEIRKRFLKHIWMLVEYWDTEAGKTDSREKLRGLAFSILATIDGDNPEMPGFLMIPFVNDEKVVFEGGDIGGYLHEHFYLYEPRNERS